MTPYPDSRTVLTTYGPILGRRLIYEGEKQVDAFQGIPYAKPPVGELRFKKPVPPEPWTEVKETKAFGLRSIQIDFPGRDSGIPTSEDCLTLNVFTPVWEPESSKGFAVMVFIHGGGFYTDSCVTYGDSNICKHLWVKDNISRFNGNPDNVTLFGQSAGGALVDLLSISPHSRDLFHKVIPMAGNASCYWSLSNFTVEKCRAKADELGIEICDDSEKFLEELCQIPAEKFALSLFDATSVDLDGELPPTNLLGPRFDGDFFPKHPSELRKETPAKPRIVDPPKKWTDVYKVASFLFPEDKFPLNFKQLRQEYIPKVFGTEILDENMRLRKAVEANSDFEIVIGSQENVVEALEKGEEAVYLYRFDHFNPKMYGNVGEHFAFLAATHCSDIGYLFGIPIVCPESIADFDEKDFKVIHTMTSLLLILRNMAIQMAKICLNGRQTKRQILKETLKSMWSVR